jgi:hypothetical protein
MARYTINEYRQCLHEETSLDFDVTVEKRDNTEVVRALHNGILVYEASVLEDMEKFRQGIPQLLRIRNEERGVRLQLLDALQGLDALESALNDWEPLRDALEREGSTERVRGDEGSVLDTVQDLRFKLAKAILSEDTQPFTIRRILADVTTRAIRLP